MQEEVENRSVNLAITTTKLTARAICNGIRKYVQYRGKVKSRKVADKAAKKAAPIRGKQEIAAHRGCNLFLRQIRKRVQQTLPLKRDKE